MQLMNKPKSHWRQAFHCLPLPDLFSPAVMGLFKFHLLVLPLTSLLANELINKWSKPEEREEAKISPNLDNLCPE